MTSRAEQLRDLLIDDDGEVSLAVNDNIVLEADYIDYGIPAIVIGEHASHEPPDSLRVHYRHNSPALARGLAMNIKRRIESLPLGEVLTAVSYIAPFGGRITVRVGSLVEEATCQA